MSAQAKQQEPKLLLTGAFGNVGTSIILEVRARQLRGESCSLYCFDKKSPVTEANEAKLHAELGRNAFVTIWGDLTDTEQVDKIVAGGGFDSVLHVAAVIPPPAYAIPAIARKVNVDATFALLDACAKLDRKPRFVFASSYSVVGPQNPNRNPPRVTGATPVNPKDNYGCHKAACEKRVREYPGEWVILRLGAISITIRLLRTQKVNAVANAMLFDVPANQHRHGVHSKDVAYAFVEAGVTEKDVRGKVLMIGGDKSWESTAWEFNNFIFAALGIGTLDVRAWRQPPKDLDEAFYYEALMDTTESQELLAFQRHTIQDWRREVRAEMWFGQLTLTRMVAPIIRYWLVRGSQNLHYNLKGLPNPNASKSIAELVGSHPEPY